MKSNTEPQEIEFIKIGKRIVRTNIIPIYFPVDETHTTEVVDYWTYDEKIEYLPCYAILTFGQYSNINCAVSIASGYDIRLSTAREFTMNPPACKVNISEDSYDIRFVLPVGSDVHSKFPELFEGLELSDTYVPVDSPIQELLVDIDNQDTLNWTLVQFSVGGNSEDGLVLKISPETMEFITPEIVEAIKGLGLNVSM